MREWNAASYHRISDPQVRWGLTVLNRLRLAGDERVIDAGCGTGRLTEHLARRLPRGTVLAIDLSANMLQAARQHLDAVDGIHVAWVRGDASALPFRDTANAIFSTATFHWILDHEALFRSLFMTLTPGGRLMAQCGGRGNLARFVARAERMTAQDPFKPLFAGWTPPWEFADATTTAQRLAAAGFEAVDTSEISSPERFPSAEAFREFVVNVVCRPYLSRMADSGLQARFIDLIVDEYAKDTPAFELDYRRLNLAGRRPR